jgi:hypothetical protein
MQESIHPPTDAAWAGPAARRGPSPIMMMIVGALIFATGCGAGLFTGWTAGMANSYGGFGATPSSGTPLNASLAVDAPATVQVGETFDLVVTVKNHAELSQVVKTVDLGDALCDQFEIVNVDPAPAGTVQEYGWHEYTYDTVMPAEGETTFTITMRARYPGTHEGSVDVYMVDYQSISREVKIVATPVGE